MTSYSDITSCNNKSTNILPFILLQSNLLMNDMKYPHIVHIERGITEDVNSKVSSAVGTQVIELEG